MLLLQYKPPSPTMILIFSVVVSVTIGCRIHFHDDTKIVTFKYFKCVLLGDYVQRDNTLLLVSKRHYVILVIMSSWHVHSFQFKFCLSTPTLFFPP